MEKPVDEFGFKYRERGIRQSWCKPCYVEYKRLWYLENRDKHIAHVRAMRDRLSEVNQLRMWQYLASHRASIAESAILSSFSLTISATRGRTSLTCP
jgi:hypothetical protein